LLPTGSHGRPQPAAHSHTIVVAELAPLDHQFRSIREGRLLLRRLVVRKRRKRAGENDRQRECETQQFGCRHGQTLKNSLAPGSLRPLTAAEVRPALLWRR